MTPDQIDGILRQTLDDVRLSRSEKRALREHLAELSMSPPDVAMCHQAAFALAHEVMDVTNTRSVLQWLEEVSSVLRQVSQPDEPSPGNVVACFSPGDDCWKRITALLKTASVNVDVCVFTLTDDRVTSEVLATHLRGVRVRVITDNEKADDPGSDAKQLAVAGVPVRVDRTPHHMHHKFALFDDRRLLTGSYNWTRSAAEWNEENLIVTEDQRLVNPFQSEFDRLWQNCDPLV